MKSLILIILLGIIGPLASAQSVMDEGTRGDRQVYKIPSAGGHGGFNDCICDVSKVNENLYRTSNNVDAILAGEGAGGTSSTSEVD